MLLWSPVFTTHGSNPKVSSININGEAVEFNFASCRPVTPKSVRPDRFWQKNLPKLVPPDHFCCQNWSGRTNFGCQNQSPGGPILAKNYLPKSVPHKVALLFMRVHGCMDIAIITGYLASYGYLYSLHPII